MRVTDLGAQDIAPGQQARDPWYLPYVVRVAVTDAVIVVVAVSVAYWVRFDQTGVASVSGQLSPSYLALSILLMAAWVAALDLGRSRDRRVIGHGPAEYQRVFSLSLRLFAGLAIVAYLLRMEVGRGYVGIAAPLGTGLLLAGRYVWRQWLHRQRAQGRALSGMLVIGTQERAARFVRAMRRKDSAGFEVVGVCVPGDPDDRPAEVEGVPVLGGPDDAVAAARAAGAGVVVAAGADAVTAEVVRRLGWDLEGTHIDLAVAPELTDVAGPRVLMQPVSGLPLIYVDEPQFTGAKYVAKSVADWVGALVLTLLLSPVLAAVAVAVRLSGPGPVLFVQERVGRDGRTFPMYKFRSMVHGAHDRLADVLAEQGGDVRPFYKPRNDPRVTPVGRVLRRTSLDELPQLFNVLRGEMSLVGPRPQIAGEVAQYDRGAHRRLLVRPGLTGLWQVSGRSDLSPEEGIRMDVYYVENWTLFGDLLILARTVRTLLVREGAY